MPPDATVDDTMLVFPPGGAYGPWRLDVLLVQRGVEKPLATATATVELRPWPVRPAPPAS